MTHPPESKMESKPIESFAEEYADISAMGNREDCINDFIAGYRVGMVKVAELEFENNELKTKLQNMVRLIDFMKQSETP